VPHPPPTSHHKFNFNSKTKNAKVAGANGIKDREIGLYIVLILVIWLAKLWGLRL
jgi:hypothetical protein